MKKVLWGVVLLSLIGVVLSAISLLQHYSNESSFCNLSEGFSCDIVNRGIYSEILGVPVALVGIMGYVLLGVLALWSRKRSDLLRYVLIAAIGGLAFSLYLTGIEAFVLHTFCVLCLGSQFVILLITILSVVAYRSYVRNHLFGS